MSKKPKQRKNENQAVVISITHSDVAILVVNKQGEDQPPIARRKQIIWRDNAKTIDSDDGVKELTAAIKQLVTSEGVGGAVVNVVLSSDFCVTRVVAGDNETVTKELKNLEERSGLYLSLGKDDKALAVSKRPIDARTEQAWLSVTNKGTVQAIVQATDVAGVYIQSIEHSLVASARSVGYMKADAEEPVIIIELNENSLELGISFGGNLLLDFHPGGGDAQEKIAEIVERHLQRLQRYCNRYFRFTKGEIRKVYLCGSEAEVESVLAQFGESDVLTAEVLDHKAVGLEWTNDEELIGCTKLVAPVGGAIGMLHPDLDEFSPNLMMEMKQGMKEPLMPLLIRTAWPIAVCLLVSLGIYGLAQLESSRVATVTAEKESLSSSRLQVTMMKGEAAQANKRMAQIGKIRGNISNPEWDQLVKSVAGSLPEGVWLDSARVDINGEAKLTGPSESQDGVFDFVKNLSAVKALKDVNIEATTPFLFQGKSGYRFEIKCQVLRVNDRNEETEGTENDD
jgi:Tfp pilus assembly protein PilN